MIAFLEGEVVEKGSGRVVLAVAGVGYELAAPTSTVSGLPAVGRSAVVHTRLVVRDDQMILYGFSSPDERQLFDLRGETDILNRELQGRLKIRDS